jgi:hypothetical protein
MPSIVIGLDQRHEVNSAHAEYTKKTGAIETIIEGAPVFSGAVQSGQTLIVPKGFADFLQIKGISFKSV